MTTNEPIEGLEAANLEAAARDAEEDAQNEREAARHLKDYYYDHEGLADEPV